MNIGTKFFRYVKTVNILVCIFVFIVLVPAIAVNMYERKWNIVLLCILVISIGASIMIFLFKYYQNMVTEIKFVDSETLEIITNKDIFHYKIQQVSKVEKQSGRIYIYCCGEHGEKKFIYQTIYFVREHMPDIGYWKRNLIYTKFVGFDKL